MHNKSSKLVINSLLVIKKTNLHTHTSHTRCMYVLIHTTKNLAPKTKRHVFTTPSVHYFPPTVVCGLKEPLNQQAITKNQEKNV
jgi:hypothetical protein